MSRKIKSNSLYLNNSYTILLKKKKYNYAGAPWKTQKRIRSLLDFWFRNDLMGVPGDEDGGGMTSFVEFSYMGFYPVTPGMPVYNIGSPQFDDVKIDLGNGKFFEIQA